MSERRHPKTCTQEYQQGFYSPKASLGELTTSEYGKKSISICLHQVSSHLKLSNILYVRGLCRVERLCDLMPVTVCVTVCLGKPSKLVKQQ